MGHYDTLREGNCPHCGQNLDVDCGHRRPASLTMEQQIELVVRVRLNGLDVLGGQIPGREQHVRTCDAILATLRAHADQAADARNVATPRALIERAMESCQVNNDHDAWDALLWILDPASLSGERLHRVETFLHDLTAIDAAISAGKEE